MPLAAATVRREYAPETRLEIACDPLRSRLDAPQLIEPFRGQRLEGRRHPARRGVEGASRALITLPHMQIAHSDKGGQVVRVQRECLLECAALFGR